MIGINISEKWKIIKNLRSEMSQHGYFLIIPEIQITPETVKNAVKPMKPQSATGPENIPTELIK